MKQKVLFFDIDGTLIWSYGGIQEIPQSKTIRCHVLGIPETKNH